MASRRFFRYDRKIGKVVELTTEPTDPKLISSWPIYSESMAVDPSQIKDAQAVLKRHGVQTEYDREGRPILRDRHHRKRHAEAMGFYDRNSYGGSDARAKNR